MQKWFILFVLSFLPVTAEAGFLNEIACDSDECQGLTDPEQLKPRHVVAPRVLEPLVAPQATTPTGLFSSPGAPVQQTAPSVVPPGTIDPPEPLPGPISNNSCHLAFNNVCNEPSPCARGTDGHDCGIGGSE